MASLHVKLTGGLRAALADPVSGHLLRGSAVSMIVRVIGLAVGLLSHLLLSRTLGVDAYGQYAIALGWALILVIPARLGLDNSVLRFATIYQEENRLGALRGLVRFIFGVLILTAGTIALGLFVQEKAGLDLLQGFDPALLPWMAAMIFPLAALGIFSAIMRTAKRILASQLYEQLVRPAAIIIGVAVFWLGGMTFDAQRAMMITAAATLAALAGVLLHFRAVFPRLSLHPVDAHDRSRWLALSWPLFLFSTIQEILNQIGVIMLGHLSEPVEAGQFTAALRLSSLVAFALVALTSISGPMIAWAHQKDDRQELARIARLNARLGLGFALAMSLFLAVIGPAALRAFGAGFENAYSVMLVLLVGGLVTAASGSVAYLLTMTGRQNVALSIFTVSLGVSFLVNLLAIPRYGAMGAAAAATATASLSHLLMLLYVRRTLGIDASALSLRPRTS